MRSGLFRRTQVQLSLTLLSGRPPGMTPGYQTRTPLLRRPPGVTPGDLARTLVLRCLL